MLLLKAKLSSVVASIPVAGGGVFPSTFNAAKSVWVSSFEAGPRSRLFGALDLTLLLRVACRQRAQMNGVLDGIGRAARDAAGIVIL